MTGLSNSIDIPPDSSHFGFLIVTGGGTKISPVSKLIFGGLGFGFSQFSRVGVGGGANTVLSISPKSVVSSTTSGSEIVSYISFFIT